MTTRRFDTGDTVRILATFPRPHLHGRTGTVLGYTPSGRFVIVQLVGRIDRMLDTELELVTDVA